LKGRRYRLTDRAEDDVATILAHTHREFGDRQFWAYAALIEKAAQMVGQQPLRINSKSRDELGAGVRSFHLEVAARRRGAASHVVYYIPTQLEDGEGGAIILRLLWDGMDPWALVSEGLAELE